MSELTNLLKNSQYTVVFTGAGMSTHVAQLHRNFIKGGETLVG